MAECVYEQDIHIDPESGLVDKVIIYGVSDVYVSQADFDTFDPLDGVYARTRKGVNVPVSANLVAVTTDTKTYQYVAAGDEDTATAMRNVYLWAAPTITAPDETIYQGDTWGVMHDVTAIDYAGNNITNLVTWSGSYDTETDGTYTITYSANSHGFIGTEDRILTVLPWAPPNLIVPPYVSVIMKETYDPMDGVSAEDFDGNDLTADVTYSGTVNTDRLGQYPVTFSVTDSKGRTTTKTQIVEVVQSPYATYLFTDGTFIVNAERANLATLEAAHGRMTNEYDPGPYNFQRPTDQLWRGQANRIKNVYFGSTFEPTSMAYMFYNCREALSFDFTNLNTILCENFRETFSQCMKLPSINVRSFDTRSATDMHGMFLDCWELKELDVSTFDTHNVMDFGAMFYDCVELRVIYATPAFVIPTGAQTTSMFAICQNLTGQEGTEYTSSKADGERARIDDIASAPGYFTSRNALYTTLYHDGTLVINERFVQREANKLSHGVIEHQYSYTDASNNWRHNWNNNTRATKAVFANNVAPTTMREWFKGCTALQEIDWNRLDSTNVTDMGSLFSSCTSLTTCDLSKLHTSNVTDMSGIFYQMKPFAGFMTYVNNWDTSNVTNMAAMFMGIKGMTSIMPKFDTSSATSMSSMFGYMDVPVINISSMKFDSLVDAPFMFGMNSSLRTIYSKCPSTFPTGISAPNMFTNSVNLVGGAGTTYSVTGPSYAKCDGGTADPGYFTNSSEYYGTVLYPDGRLIFNELKSDHPANISIHGDPVAVFTEYDPDTNPYHFTQYSDAPWFGAGTVYSVEIGAEMAPDNMSYWFAMLNDCTEFLYLDKIDTSNVTRMEATFEHVSAYTNVLDLSFWDVSSVEYFGHCFAGCTASDINMTGWDTSSATDMNNMFAQTAATQFNSLANLDTSNVTNMEFMFADSRISTADLTGLDTSNVENFYMMFSGATNMTTAVLPIDTSSATNMDQMFWGCENIEQLDIRSFTSANAPTKYGMFGNCVGLRTIRATNAFVGTETDYRMFYLCTHLVGGNGTTYSPSHIDGDYGRIDTSATPGYFTQG